MFAASLCLSMPAQAKDLHVTATVGQPVRVYGHVRFSKNCGPGPIPAFTVVTPPKLGTLSTKVETVTLTSPDFGTCGAGLSGPGTVVYYSARAPGRDSFHYRMSSPGLPTTEWQITVDVASPAQ
jgi:hypothetical protein